MTEIILTSTVLILVIVALRFFLRGRISARLQYALWILVALRLLLPFSLFESPISVMKLVPDPPVLSAPPAVNAPVEPIGPDSPAQPESPEQNANGKEPPPQTSGPDIAALAAGVWLGGALLCGAVFIVSNIRLSRRLKKCRLPAEQTDFPLPVYIAEGLSSPCLYGMWRPVVYLTPESLGEPERLRHILTHELTHFRHGDFLWPLLRAVCVCVYWFHPLVWLAASLSRRDSELACDEGVLCRLGDESRTAYGKTLIEMMTVPGPSDLFHCSTAMSSSHYEIRERLRLIAKRPKRFLFTAAAALLVASVTVAATFGAAETVQPPIPPTTETAAQELWNARTDYVGDAPAVIKLSGLLPMPDGFALHGVELFTRSQPYSVEITALGSTEACRSYNDSDNQYRFTKNALTLFSLIENVDTVIYSLADGNNSTPLSFTLEQAETILGTDFREVSKTQEGFLKLKKEIDSYYKETEIPANYSITRVRKDGSAVLPDTPANQQLAKDLIMNALVKSAAREGSDPAALEEYYLIRQTFPENNETHDYYAYLLPDGKAVLQSGVPGYYSILSPELFANLEKNASGFGAEMDVLSFRGTDWYLVSTEEQLRSIGTGKYAMNLHYMQNNDIQLSDKEWVPIGTEENPFTGTFNGNGFEIKGLTMKNPDTQYIGLFAFASGANIHNITMRDYDIATAGSNVKGKSVAPIVIFAQDETRVYDTFVYPKK